MVSVSDARRQAVTGLVPPQTAEAKIRVVWPSVNAFPGVARVGRALIRSIILAPLGWLLLAPVYFLKILPFQARRYTLTNRRLMIQRGLSATVAEEVDLATITDVRVQEGSYDPFFRTGTLDILSEGKVVMNLAGVPGPDSFRHAILNARTAWAPSKS
jgi:hypothetical protein